MSDDRSSHDMDERFADWVDGRMSERELERFEAELRVNAALRQRAEAYRSFVAALRGALQQDAGDVDVVARVMAEVSGELGATDPTRPAPARRRSIAPRAWFASSLVAAALLLVLPMLGTWGLADRAPESAVQVTQAALEPGAESPADPQLPVVGNVVSAEKVAADKSSAEGVSRSELGSTDAAPNSAAGREAADAPSTVQGASSDADEVSRRAFVSVPPDRSQEVEKADLQSDGKSAAAGTGVPGARENAQSGSLRFTAAEGPAASRGPEELAAQSDEAGQGLSSLLLRLGLDGGAKVTRLPELRLRRAARTGGESGRSRAQSVEARRLAPSDARWFEGMVAGFSRDGIRAVQLAGDPSMVSAALAADAKPPQPTTGASEFFLGASRRLDDQSRTARQGSSVTEPGRRQTAWMLEGTAVELTAALQHLAKVAGDNGYAIDHGEVLAESVALLQVVESPANSEQPQTNGRGRVAVAEQLAPSASRSGPAGAATAGPAAGGPATPAPGEPARAGVPEKREPKRRALRDVPDVTGRQQAPAPGALPVPEASTASRSGPEAVRLRVVIVFDGGS